MFADVPLFPEAASNHATAMDELFFFILGVCLFFSTLIAVSIVVFAVRYHRRSEADRPQSINHLVEILGGDVVHIPKRPGEPDCTWANIDKIRTRLGWTPTVAFEDGVRRMLVDIELWRDAPLWEPDSIAQATETWFRYLGEKR